MGATIVRFCPVTGVRRENGEWVVDDAARRNPLRICGQRRRLSRPRGRQDVRPRRADDGDEPSVHTVRGDPRARRMVEGSTASKLPLLRDVDTSYYLRQEKNGMNLGPYERNCRAHWVEPQRSDAGRFLLPALPRRSRAAGALSRRRRRARADPRHGRPVQGDQRADPLRARRQSADRPDARRAQCLRGLRLHLRHRPGRRRRQGAGRMGDRGPDRMGHVVVRPAPLHRLCRRRRTIASPRAWRSTATNMRSASRATPGRRAATASCRRSTIASRRSAPSSTPTMAGSAPPGTPSPATTFRRRRRRRSAATARGSRASARSAWPCATPPASSTCPASRASALQGEGARDWLASLITGVVPKPGRIGLGYFADERAASSPKCRSWRWPRISSS